MEGDAMVKIDKAKVEQLMRERGFSSFTQLAAAAGLHHNTMYNVLDNPKFESVTLAKLATALECSPVDLMTWNGFAPEPFSPAPVSL